MPDLTPSRFMRPCEALLLASLALAALVAGCRGEVPALTTRFEAFGGLADLSLVHLDQPSAERAAKLVREDIAALELAWNPVNPDGLGRVNDLLPGGQPFVAPPAVLPILHLSQTLSERSGDLFNPTLGALQALWGFCDHPSSSHPPPDDRPIARLVATNPRMSDIAIAGVELTGHNPALNLDFGSIAKGAAIDLAIRRLRTLKVQHALLQIGGTLRAIGDRSGQPWRVAIRRGSGAGVLAMLKMRGDESMSTVSAHDRNFIHAGTTYHDILDPRTGWPATGAQSVTVVCRDAAKAQASATALFVAGPRDWVAVARDLDIRFALLVDRNGVVLASPEMRARLEPLDASTSWVTSEPLAPGAEPAASR